jgi:hypothetical protein
MSQGRKFKAPVKVWSVLAAIGLAVATVGAL